MHRLWAKFDNSDQGGVSEILFAKICMEQHPKKLLFYRLVDIIRDLSTCFDVSSLTVGFIFGGESGDELQ